MDLLIKSTKDSNLHSRLAMALITADEVVCSPPNPYLIVSSMIHPGTPRNSAAVVTGFGHRNHIVECWIVAEHCQTHEGINISKTRQVLRQSRIFCPVQAPYLLYDSFHQV